MDASFGLHWMVASKRGFYMDTILLIVCALLALGCVVKYILQRRLDRSVGVGAHIARSDRVHPHDQLHVLSAVPKRITNPMQTSLRSKPYIWKFNAGAQACMAAWKRHGKKVEVSNSLPIPLPECSNCEHCDCRYFPLADQRHLERRTQSDRRDTTRPGLANPDRRFGFDRRNKQPF